MSIVRGNDELAYYLKEYPMVSTQIHMSYNIIAGKCPLRLNNLTYSPTYCSYDNQIFKDRISLETHKDKLLNVEDVYKHFMDRHFKINGIQGRTNLAHMIIEKMYIIVRNTKHHTKDANLNLKAIALRELNKDVDLPAQVLSSLFDIGISVTGKLLYQGMTLKGKPNWVKNIEKKTK